MNNLIYYPSISAKYTKYYFINNDTIFKRNFQYYNDLDLNYNFALLSAGNSMDYQNIRNDMKLEKTFVLGDSGGFQIANNIKNLEDFDLEKLYNWLYNNSDVFFILDIPNENYEFSIKKTILNRDYFLKKKTDKKILNVIQTNCDFEYFKKWFHDIDIDGFDGYGIGGLTNNEMDFVLLKSIIDYILLNTKIKISYIHLFGINNVRDFTKLKTFLLQYPNIIFSIDTALPFIYGAREILIGSELNLTKSIFFKKETSYLNLINLINFFKK